MSEMKDHLLIALNGLEESHLARIAETLADRATWERIDEAAPEEIYADKLMTATALIGWPPVGALLESPVRFHQLPSAGYEKYAGQGLAKKPDYVMCNARGVMSVPVAEHWVAQMFALSRNLHHYIKDQPRKRWQRQAEHLEITGGTVCIVGLGDIGTEVAKRALGLGMNVIGVRADATRPHPLTSRVYAVEQIAGAVAGADHVVIVCPANESTKGLFDRRLLAAMKRRAFIYNLSRGVIIDTPALIAALQDGHLAGAGLDVFTAEPLPPQSPLWDMENVIIMPHASGRSVKEHDRMCDLICDNLCRFFTAQPLINIIPL